MKNRNSTFTGFIKCQICLKSYNQSDFLIKMNDRKGSNIVHSLAPLFFLFLSPKLRIWLVYLIPWSIMAGLPLISPLTSSPFSFMCRVQGNHLSMWQYSYTNHKICLCHSMNTGMTLFFTCLHLSCLKNNKISVLIGTNAKFIKNLTTDIVLTWVYMRCHYMK